MKKIFLLLLFTHGFTATRAQKKDKQWKTNFGIDIGIPFGGLTPTTGSGNPMVQGGATLKDGMGFSGGATIQFIKTKKKSDGRIAPAFGIQLKALYNNFVSTASGVYPSYDDQTIKISEMAVPILFKVCIMSKEGDIKSSTDPDVIEIRKGSHDGEYEGRYTPGQYHAGYHTTVAVFIYAGPQIGFLNNTTFESSSATYKTGFETIRKNLKSNNISVVGGMQFMLGRTYFDVSYQKGLQTIYNGANVFMNGLIGRFGVLF